MVKRKKKNLRIIISLTLSPAGVGGMREGPGEAAAHHQAAQLNPDCRGLMHERTAGN